MRNMHKWNGPISVHLFLLLMSVSALEFVFNLQRYDLSKQCNKSTDWCHSAMPLHTPCLHVMTALSVKHYTISFTVIWRGALVNCLVSFTVPLSFCLSLQCAWSSIHTCIAMFAQAVYTQHWPFLTSSHMSLPTFSTVADVLYPGVLCFFSALIASSKPFICQERFCLHLLSVLTQKNKLPLICQCSLICSHTVFFRTSLQVRLLRWVG